MHGAVQKVKKKRGGAPFALSPELIHAHSRFLFTDHIGHLNGDNPLSDGEQRKRCELKGLQTKGDEDDGHATYNTRC
jgi:hypothetical protein